MWIWFYDHQSAGAMISSSMNRTRFNDQSINHPPPWLIINYYSWWVLPYEDNSFDVVTLKYVLHHEKNKDQLLGECLRIAKLCVIIIESVYAKRYSLPIMRLYDVRRNSTASGKMEFHWFNYFKEWELVLLAHKFSKLYCHNKLYAKNKFYSDEIIILNKESEASLNPKNTSYQLILQI